MLGELGEKSRIELPLDLLDCRFSQAIEIDGRGEQAITEPMPIPLNRGQLILRGKGCVCWHLCFYRSPTSVHRAWMLKMFRDKKSHFA